MNNQRIYDEPLYKIFSISFFYIYIDKYDLFNMYFINLLDVIIINAIIYHYYLHSSTLYVLLYFIWKFFVSIEDVFHLSRWKKTVLLRMEKRCFPGSRNDLEVNPNR